MDDACAELIIETVLQAVSHLRSAWRGRRPADLTVPQFRALGFVARRGGVSLSQVADHIGLTISATSRAIEELVNRGLLIHDISPTDRRRARLSATPTGEALLHAAWVEARSRLANEIAVLDTDQRTMLMESMTLLSHFFATNEVVDHDRTDIREDPHPGA